MRRWLLLCLALLLVASAPFEPRQESARPAAQAEFVPNQIVVKWEAGLSDGEKRKIQRDFNARTVSEIPSINVAVWRVPQELKTAVQRVRKRTGIVYAEPNYIASAADIYPNDPGFPTQYNMFNIHAPAGWSLDTGAVWVTIAIVDSGVDLTHPDLSVKILPGYDFVNNDDQAQDDYGHGTHVAGIAAASTNNFEGVAGVNWGANILPVKVLNAAGSGSYANVAAGITWATDHGAQVINMSLGGSAPSQVLEDAINYAYNRGVILVAAAGNNGAPSVLYPAAYDPVIAVSATDENNNLAGFSNYGPAIDIAAPGVSIYSTFLGGIYGYNSGTSMATPHVSGLAAILRGIPGNGPARVESILKSTALDLGAPGWDEYFGYGLIQMDAAIQLAQPLATATPTQTNTPTATSTFTPRPPHQSTRPAGPLGGLPSPTVTSTLTLTASPLPATLTFSPTPTFLLAPNATPTAPAEEVTAARQDTDWTFPVLPCAGFGLIGLGLWLVWMTRRLRTRRR